MKNPRYTLLFFICFVLFFGVPVAYSQSARSQYIRAIQCAKEKQYDFAFLEFRGILRDFPKTKYAKEARFAMGEYFYGLKMYYEAIKNFTEYLNSSVDSRGAIFAKVYLLKIIEQIKNPAAEEKGIVEGIKSEFFSKPLFLLFSDYKEASYRSALQNNFKIRYYMDMIEVYKNDEVFIKITP